ncbi:potassium-transporting ATPase subunit B, partial [Alkalihalophilus lindianensis]|nr:potassium-transporting ATPase subunit B [Alkalihalophilus lindianensis]
IKLNPIYMMKNPVMFVVEMGTIIVLLMMCMPNYFHAEGAFGYNLAVFVILLFTILFANFAEALAEGRGKAQADSLKKTKQETMAKVIQKDE